MLTGGFYQTLHRGEEIVHFMGINPYLDTHLSVEQIHRAVLALWITAEWTQVLLELKD